jgi:predicted RNA-binding protein YlxR (DUF448 family)
VAKKKPGPRRKHIPLRTCVGCRKVLAKRSLTRVVRTAEGLKIDPSGKMAGRGAYLHNLRSCWTSGIKGGLAHALKMELTEKDLDILKSYMETLPEIDPYAEDQVNNG